MKLAIILCCLCFVLVSGQAPDDFSRDCRTNFRYRGSHDWIPYVNDTAVGNRGDMKWQVLLDQFDYQTLLQSGVIWTVRDFDGDGLQFTESAATCTSVLRAPSTSYRNSSTQNWIFTQAVSYLDAVEVFVNSTVRFAGCIQRASETPPCRNSFVTLRRFDTTSSQSTNERTNRDNYQPYLGDLMLSRLQQNTALGEVTIVKSYDRPLNVDLTYFAIEDTGTFGSIERIIVYYRVAQGYEDGLVVCPSVGLPPNNSMATNSGTCTCKLNSSPVSDSMVRVCNGAGVCQENPSCACDPGYGYNNMTMECQGCAIGTYKADTSNAACRPCPANSTTDRLNSTFCECFYGTARNLTRPDDVCIHLDLYTQNVCAALGSSATLGNHPGALIAITAFATLYILMNSLQLMS